jgi:hypothetical protein
MTRLQAEDVAITFLQAISSNTIKFTRAASLPLPAVTRPLDEPVLPTLMAAIMNVMLSSPTSAYTRNWHVVPQILPPQIAAAAISFTPVLGSDVQPLTTRVRL